MNRNSLLSSSTAVAVGLFLLLLAIYVLSMPVRIPASQDAVAEINMARSLEPQAPRPNHLLLTPTYHAVLALFETALPGKKEFLVLQLLNATAGALAGTVLFLTLQRLGCPVVTGLIGALLVSLSWAQWLHSREVESGVLAQLMAVSSFYLLTCIPRDPRAVAVARWMTVLAGASLALAILFAMNLVLLVPALAVAMLVLTPDRGRVRRLLLFGATAAVLTLVPYILQARMVFDPLTPQRFLDWVTRHSSGASVTPGRTLTVSGILRTASGTANYFTGYTAVTTALKQHLRGEDSIPVSFQDWTRFLLGAALALALLFHLAHPGWTRQQAGLRAVAGLALGAVFLFNAMWLGSDPQFWLPAMPFVLVHACVVNSGLRRGRIMRRVAAWSAAVAVLCLGVFGWVYPVPTLGWRRGGHEWQRANALAGSMKPGDLVIDMAGWGQYTRFFGSYEVVHPVYSVDGRGSAYLRNLDAKLERALTRGSRIYALEVFVSTAPTSVGRWDEVESHSGLRRAEVLSSLRARYQVDVAPGQPPDQGVWLIRACLAP